MTLPLWLLSAAKWLKNGAGAVLSALGKLSPVGWLALILGALLALQTVRIEGLWFLHKGFKDVIADYEAIEAAVAPKKAKADEAAGKAVDETKADVEAGNQRARDAAQGSDDPLRDGLNALAK